MSGFRSCPGEVFPGPRPGSPCVSPLPQGGARPQNPREDIALRGAWKRLLLPLVAALLVAPSAGAQQAGTVSGRVTAVGTNEPLQDARVMVVGTTIGTNTNAEGRYTIRGVPLGAQSIRVLRVGFSEQRKPVTVAAGQAATLDFQLAQNAIKLQEVVTTATGEQRRVELGNAVASVDAAQLVETQPIRSVSELLTARAPGVTVLPPNTTGAGARVRIRGNSSLSLANDPIYIIDGIRMTSNVGSSSIGVGGTSPSRVNDLNPDDIENIEIVKGPSAATLYGTDAANGVIVITTKRGRAGAPQWRVGVEGGVLTDENKYPSSYTLWGHSPGATTARSCLLSQVAAGTCLSDSLSVLNIREQGDINPFGRGNRQQYSLQVSGGTDAIRYFVGSEFEDEVGVFKMDDVSRRRLDSIGVGVRPEWSRPNALKRTNVRANLNATLSPKIDLGITTNFIRSKQRLPQLDNNINGLLFSMLGGPGTRTGTGSLGEPLNGYGIFTPAEMFQYTTTQGINRFIGGANAAWRPFSWMNNRANLGVDYTSRVDQQLCRRNNCPDFGSNRQGFAVDNRAGIRNFSVDLGSTMTFVPGAAQWMESRTTVGAQYVNYQFDQNGANGANLPVGTQTVTAGAVPGASQATVMSKTLGAFVEEQVAIRDRLFLTAAVRSDQNSAFGTDFQSVFYPKFSASWLTSQEEFFPKPDWMDQLRLRASFGAAGQQPGPNDAARFFVPGTFNIAGVDQPVVVFSSLGNAELKPERATEFEAGFDLRAFQRANLEVTYYSKYNRDALIAAVLPPSVGVQSTTQLSNLGAVKNAGIEAMLNTQVLNGSMVGWDMTLTGSRNDNKLVSLGSTPPQIGTTIHNKAGYPLNSYWQRPITKYIDKNQDGIIRYSSDTSLTEVYVGDTAVFKGYSTPRYEVNFQNGLDLWNRRLRLVALLNYKGGHYTYDNTNRIRCASRNNCRELLDKSAPLDRQAAVVALRDHPSRTQDGYISPADFLRFRELSATFSLPDTWANRYLRSKNASLNFAVRNVGMIWTKYTGIDPEADYNTAGDVPSDLVTPAPPRYMTIRLNLGF